jgi:murein DD-endopeptidase MepM/ murein hydrolase activator NlpD
MNQPYFIVVLAHSLHGRIRRFHVDQKVILAVLGLALLGSFTLFGMVSSYLRMALKVSNYNNLRAEADNMRSRYQRLLMERNQANQQMASLQLLASEVSMAYGLKRESPRPAIVGPLPQTGLTPSFGESLEEYDLLKSASLRSGSRGYSRRWLINPTPQLWPIAGRLQSFFGHRDDPLSGNEAFHAGLDIECGMGDPVKVTADGIVGSASWYGGYGRLITVDHGQGLQTYYAHLSRVDVIPGQEVRTGQVIGGCGASGKVTGVHLHYEVRRNGAPTNPYSYLKRASVSTTPRELGF